MLTFRHAVALACTLCLALPACAARHRGAAGGTIAAIGASAVGVGFCVATAFPCGSDDDPDPWAPTVGTAPTSTDADYDEANPRAGVATMTVGLALIVIGGILYGTGAPPPDPYSLPKAPPSVPTGPSPAPTF